MLTTNIFAGVYFPFKPDEASRPLIYTTDVELGNTNKTFRFTDHFNNWTANQVLQYAAVNLLYFFVKALMNQSMYNIGLRVLFACSTRSKVAGVPDACRCVRQKRCLELQPRM